MGDWSQWSDCTQSCSGGQRYRSREIVAEAENGGQPCTGDLHGTETCNTQSCPGQSRRDCVWGSWNPWSGCSATCGGGQKQRSREIKVSPSGGGRLCEAHAALAVAPCGTRPCVDGYRDCEWADWGEWSLCSASCGGGNSVRVRSIDQVAQKGGEGCSGAFEQYRTCNTKVPCESDAIDCSFTQWGQWSSCSDDCNGHRSRSRRVGEYAKRGGLPCAGSTMDVEPCNLDADACTIGNVDCVLSDWLQWTPCSATCGGGEQHSTRRVAVPSRGRGKPCSGALHKVKSCNEDPCPGDNPTDCTWGPWSAWSACTEQCGGGQHRKHRTIVLEPSNGGHPCTGGAAIAVASCNEHECPHEVVQCVWSDWTPWTECKRLGRVVSCDGGNKQRSRHMKAAVSVVGSNSTFQGRAHPSFSANSADGRRLSQIGFEPRGRRLLVADTDDCRGEQQESMPCAMNQCVADEPVDCRWGFWSQWSSCPCSGLQERHRVIARYGRNGGEACNGPEVQARACDAQCGAEPARNCEFSTWTDWSDCPVSCGRGDRIRYRTVTQHSTGEGSQCQGDVREEEPCSTAPCPHPVDCAWGDWSEYSSCSATCGGGQQTKTRNVVNVAKAGGKPCKLADSMYIRPCNTDMCPSGARDCAFSQWTSWNSCSSTCGGGKQKRTRDIAVEATARGAPCEGPMQDWQDCNLQPCSDEEPIPCVWGLWNSWSSCSSACNGHRQRTRSIVQFADHGGMPCQGAERQLGACNMKTAACEDDWPVDCMLSDWSDWTRCTRACDGGQKYRTREVLREARNNGIPCSGPTSESSACNEQSCAASMVYDCQWDDWGEWSACTKSCSGGERQRHRKIKVQARNGGKACEPGSAMEMAACHMEECDGGPKEECGWSNWMEWGSCSATCGGGQSQRIRQLEWIPVNRDWGRRLAAEELRLEHPMLGAIRSAPRLGLGLWGEDSADELNGTAAWGSSPRRLGAIGKSVDRRLAGVMLEEACSGTQKELQPCGNIPCNSDEKKKLWVADCVFGQWSDWSSCDCTGLRTRDRSIDTPARNGGSPCVGALSESHRCEPHCDGIRSLSCVFAGWTAWSGCSQSCGGGQTFRTRTILQHAEGAGDGCNGGLENSRPCNTEQCPGARDCVLGDWSQWSKCSQPCGGGQRVRTRQISQDAAHGGNPCPEAQMRQVAPCGKEPCAGSSEPKDCDWSEWTEWSGCSRSCSGGRQYRSHRPLFNQRNGGKPCEGVYQDFRQCNSQPCRGAVVDCEFGDWTEWGQCSARCNGHMEHVRTIRTYPSQGGLPCKGAVRETTPCNVDVDACKDLVPVSRDCALSDWSPWSVCSRTCGGGQSYSTRRVVIYAEGQGEPCKGSLRRVQACGDRYCASDIPVDCRWQHWGTWSDCSVTCGGGQKYRHREIAVEPKNGGNPCAESDSMEIGPCRQMACPGTQELCLWGDWSSWSSCSTSCGSGEKTRARSLSLSYNEDPVSDDRRDEVIGRYSLDSGIRASMRRFADSNSLPVLVFAACGLLAVVFSTGWAVMTVRRRMPTALRRLTMREPNPETDVVEDEHETPLLQWGVH
uniref:Spondin-like TSP1 domain-containing protein n=1 Tax=Oxyrrhis marina TaxID=2969 RepID=A0A7S4GQJ7_OXYMA